MLATDNVELAKRGRDTKNKSRTPAKSNASAGIASVVFGVALSLIAGTKHKHSSSENVVLWVAHLSELVMATSK